MARKIALALLVGWAVVVLAMTLAPNKSGVQKRTEGLVNRRAESRAADVVGNVVLFMPIGALTYAAFPRRRRFVLAAGPLLSIGVEVYQATFLSARYPSVRDVSMNTIGHLAGMGIAAVMMREDRPPTEPPSS